MSTRVCGGDGGRRRRRLARTEPNRQLPRPWKAQKPASTLRRCFQPHWWMCGRTTRRLRCRLPSCPCGLGRADINSTVP
eukprot:365396-Chlamydomonas_euryale.AAC.12